MQLLALLSIFFSIASALPSGELSKRATSCTLTGSSISDISSIKKSCSSIIVKDLTVPAGETLDLTGLAEGTTVTFEGTTTFDYEEWEGPLISVSGTDITVTGKSGHVIDGNGAKWWDGGGSNTGKTKPKFFYAHNMYSSNIENLQIKNYPVQCFSIDNAKNLKIEGVTLDNSAGADEGHNTDAFDVGSSDSITISGCTIYNQDDCLLVNSGTNIIFKNNTCSGGHGISIGSVGGRDDNDVDTVTVSNCTVVDSDNGVRIKTVYNLTGYVKNVTYEDIILTNIAKYGIVIEGDYENGTPKGTPTSGVPITGLTLKNISGTVKSSGVDVYILVKGASDWLWSDINVTGGDSKKTCTGIPSGSGASC